MLSSLEPAAVAGLPGLLLLMGDAGVARICILGPPGTVAFIRSLTTFVQQRTLVVASELSGDEVIHWRNHFAIYSVPLRSAPTAAVTNWLERVDFQLPCRLRRAAQRRQRCDFMSASPPAKRGCAQVRALESASCSQTEPVSGPADAEGRVGGSGKGRNGVSAGDDDSCNGSDGSDGGDSNRGEEYSGNSSNGGDSRGGGGGTSSSESSNVSSNGKGVEENDDGGSSSSSSSSSSSDDSSSDSSNGDSSNDSTRDDNEASEPAPGSNQEDGRSAGASSSYPADDATTADIACSHDDDRLFEAFLSGANLSALLVRRAWTDKALRRSLIAQWLAARGGVPKSTAASIAPTSTTRPGASPASSVPPDNSSFRAPAPVELVRLPWAAETPTANETESAASAAGAISFACVPHEAAADGRFCSLLWSGCTALDELQVLVHHPLMRCFAGKEAGPEFASSPRPYVAWALHAVPAALAYTPEYRRWVSDHMHGAQHVLLHAGNMPHASGCGRAFGAAAHQRAQLRALLGEKLFPTGNGLDGGLHQEPTSQGGSIDSTCRAQQGNVPTQPGAATLLHNETWVPHGVAAIPMMRLCAQRHPCRDAAYDTRVGAPDAGAGAGTGTGDGAPSAEPGSLGSAWGAAPPCTAQCLAIVDEAAVARELNTILAMETTDDSEQQPVSCKDLACEDLPGAVPRPPTAATFEAARPPLGCRRDLLTVCMLGTGCAVPSRHRAPAAVYLHAFSRGGVLLDVGEGSLGQLAALLPPSRMVDALGRLSMVWISHHHADHHLGLLRLLSAAHEVRGPSAPPLLVVGPRAVGTFLRAYHQLLPKRARPRIFFEHCASFNSARSSGRAQLLRSGQLGLRAVRCVPVLHCADAWGVVLEHAAGWSVVYSGDTRPCEALASAGRGATLLIHEATFDDDRAADAVQKRHSTRGEALSIAERMGAYRVLLTHLSSRYSKLLYQRKVSSTPQVDEADGLEHTKGPDSQLAAASRSLVAFDMMAINLADLEQLPQHMSSLTNFIAREERFTRARQQAETMESFARSERIEKELALTGSFPMPTS